MLQQKAQGLGSAPPNLPYSGQSKEKNLTLLADST